MPSCSTFEYINYQITELFSDEIGESDYILYTLPGQSHDHQDRKKITTETFDGFLRYFYKFTKPHLKVYISTNGKSPNKPPFKFLNKENLKDLSSLEKLKISS